MRRFILPVLLATLFVAAPATAQTRVTGHPLVTPYENSSLGAGEYADYDRYLMITGFDFDSRTAITQPVEGRVTRLYYANPDDRSELEIYSNYRAALDAAGFDEIWSCAGDGECSTGSSRNAYMQANGMRAINGGNSRYAVGRLEYDGRTAYLAIGVGRHGTSIDIVETNEMETGLVAISAEALASGLDTDGHVRVDGLLFAHDDDTLLPQSDDALLALAGLLRARPDLSLYVVGHTDMSGGLAYNLSLSERRASSVIAALAERHGIDASRLEARGVGPLAPEASNTTDGGRAANRRVEIVAR
ncbi:OmpA family protein [Maricaulis sp.]|uniref:OmpA family protein n=1 Tax=Maricaulis sp. TaxID=1486257 RepID=UPI003A91494A